MQDTWATRLLQAGWVTLWSPITDTVGCLTDTSAGNCASAAGIIIPGGKIVSAAGKAATLARDGYQAYHRWRQARHLTKAAAETAPRPVG